jgi:hypothetical protein
MISERAIAGMVTERKTAPPINAVIPDGTDVPFAITKEGSGVIRLQLMSNLREIEVNPDNKSLQAEFLERRVVL